MVRTLWVLVDHNPLLKAQMHCFLDREALQSLLVALDNLIVEQQVHLRGSHDKAFELDRDLLDLETPVLHGILLGESVDHLLDLSNLLLQ